MEQAPELNPAPAQPVQQPVQELVTNGRPDYASADFQIIHDCLVLAGLTNEEAIQTLDEAWDRTAVVLQQERERQANKQAQSTLNDAAAREALAQQAAPAQPAAEEDDDDLINENMMVNNFIQDRPSSYALTKMKNKEYVELWYFTPEGCRDASENHHTQPMDTFGMMNVDGSLAFRPVASVRTSRNVVPDVKLSWEAFMMAKGLYLSTFTKDWSKKAHEIMTSFFVGLEMNPMARKPRGTRSLLAYQAKTR